MEAEVREKRRCYCSGLKDGGRDYKPRNVGGLLKLKRSRKRASGKERSPADPLILALKLILDFDLQSFQVNLPCPQLPSSW